MKRKFFFIPLFVCVIISQKIKTQEFRISKEPDNSFKLTKPNNWPGFIVYDPQRTYSLKFPLTAVFIEFGDGGFTFDFNPTRNFRGANTTRGYTVLAMATGIYDTIIPPRPRKTSANPSMYGATNAAMNVTPVLTENGPIKITSSARSIKTGEDIVYVITYKAGRLLKDGKIQFSYDQRAFSIVSDDSRTEYGNMTVKSARSYDDENISCVPGTENRQIITIKNFKITEEEKNIFITLKALDKVSDNLDGQTSISAEAFNSGDAMIGSYRLSQQIGTIHDPNWLRINNLFCFERNSNWPLVNKPKISYSLHFENTGTRGVRYCSALISLPASVPVNAIKIDSIVIGRNKISFQGNLRFSRMTTNLDDNSRFPVSISYFYDHDTLKLKFKPKLNTSPARNYVLGASPSKGSRSIEHACTIYYTIGTATINPEGGAIISGDAIEGTYWNYVRSFAKIKFEDLEFLVTGKSQLAAPCPEKLPSNIRVNQRSVYNRN